MTTETRIKRSELEKFTVAEVVDDDRVRNRFVELYNSRSIKKNGEAEYIQATESFMRAIQEDNNLQQCTTLSLYNAFLDMAIFGVNVAKQSKPLAYLLWNSVNVGTKDKPKYEKRANLEISPYGELAIRQQRGQIKYADNPVIVYEGDDYSGVYYKGGQKCVDYKPNHKSTKIVAGFLKIVRLDGSIDFVEMDMNRVNQLMGYSERKNKRGNPQGKANALYTSNKGQIDEGFFVAKLVKHAFNAYPRIDNPNANATFQTQQLENEVEETEDLYGVDEETGEIEETQAEEVQPEDDKESF